jgi:hypothetical protein
MQIKLIECEMRKTFVEKENCWGGEEEENNYRQ